MTMDELVGVYLVYAEAYYRRGDGTPTRHATNLELGLRTLRTRDPAGSFGLDALLIYRESLIRRGLKRRTINQWCGWVRGMFRWAAEEGHVPPSVPAELATLRPLKYGRSAASESPRPRLVTRAEIEATMPALCETVRAMVRVQWLTGMRSGEICAMRREDLVDVDGVMLYYPALHKTQHLGRTRVIPLFSEAMSYVDAGWEEGHVWRTRLGTAWTTVSYGQVVRRACQRLGVRVWTPGKIRRSTATYARRVSDTETVQRLLGHASADMTERYYDLGVVDAIEAGRRLDGVGWSMDGAGCRTVTDNT